MAGRLLLHVFPTFAIGGAQVRFARLARLLGDKYRHLIVALDGVHDARTLLDAGVDYRIHHLPRADKRADKRMCAANLAANLVASLVAMRAELRALRPDLLVTYNWGAIEWGLANRLASPSGAIWGAIWRAPGCPQVHIEDGFGPEEADRQLRRRVLFRRLALARSTVVVPSRTLHRIADTVWRLDPARLEYLPNGIDCERFAGPPDGALLADLGAAPGGPPVIGTIAALRPEKNLARLIRAFAELRRRTAARLVIAGAGVEAGALAALAQALGVADAVRFAGHVAAPERLLGGFDVFALSSDTEQMSFSVLEAMAAGLPVAAVDVGDVRHMLAADNAAYLTGPSAPALAAALGQLLADPARRAALGAANRARVRDRFDERRMAAGYDRLFSAAT